MELVRVNEIVEETKASQPATSTRVNYLREIRISFRGPRRKQIVVLNPENVAKFVRKILPDNSREHAIAIYVDNMSHVVGYAIVSSGSVDRCLLHPREVFQRAFLLGASALVIAHNHPVGDAKPSEADIGVTRVICEAGELFDIRMLDHIIVTDHSTYSFRENKAMPGHFARLEVVV